MLLHLAPSSHLTLCGRTARLGRYCVNVATMATEPERLRCQECETTHDTSSITIASGNSTSQTSNTGPSHRATDTAR